MEALFIFARIVGPDSAQQEKRAKTVQVSIPVLTRHRSPVKYDAPESVIFAKREVNGRHAPPQVQRYGDSHRYPAAVPGDGPTR